MINLLVFTPERRQLIDRSLKPFLRKLKRFEVEDVFVDGSFVTEKPVPGDIDGYVRVQFQDSLSCFLESTRDKFKEELHIDFYPALTDHDGMGSEEYYVDVFKATSDSPPSLKGFIVVGDWRTHV